MRLAGYTYSFASLLDKGKIDTAGIIRFYGSHQVTGIEITAGYVRPEEIPAIKQAISDIGITVACVDLVCDVTSADPEVRITAVRRLAGDLRLAAELGAKTVLVIPGFPRPETPHETQRQWFAQALKESLDESARLGVTMTVANVGWQPVVYGTSDQILEITETAGPRLKVTYDVGNFLLAGEDNLRAMSRVAPRMVHVHFKDWKIVPTAAPSAFPGVDGRLYEGEVLGDGVLNLPAALAQLKEIGYRGWISVEYEGTGEPHDAAERGIAYLRSLLDRVESKR
jgi:sugar phosphate isomerase/epimerase